VAISTIIGIPAGLYGYYSNQHDKRVEKTFEFYRTFRSDSLQKDWSLLIGRWNTKAQEARTLVRQRNQEAFEKFVVRRRWSTCSRSSTSSRRACLTPYATRIPPMPCSRTPHASSPALTVHTSYTSGSNSIMANTGPGFSRVARCARRSASFETKPNNLYRSATTVHPP
jgi:hypothetical protein